MMKKFRFKAIIGALLLSTVLPTAAFGASNEVYYPVIGSSKTSPGIYKAVPNGKASLVQKETRYVLKRTSNPPIALKDTNVYTVNSRVAKSTDKYPNQMPLQHVQQVGKDVYFARFLFRGEYAGGCGGGYADILEIYKRSSSGKISKVTTDRVSSDAADIFKVSGSYLYYAKVENAGFGNFTIMKSRLDGKNKRVLQKGVSDFWINGTYIYFEKSGKLYRMALDGKGLKSFSFKTKLYGDGGCDGGNYTVGENGVSVSGYVNDKYVNYFFDYATGKITTQLSGGLKDDRHPYILDMDVNKKRLVAQTFLDDGGDQVSVYDFSGNLIKKLHKVDFWGGGPILHSVDAKKGEFLYIDGSSLKLIKF
ncbi:DUF5050 domain-containing protein [Peribacillus glennii]|nr:DUF5050 domain-containing protein [Peribacillus glennii]